MKEPLVSHKIIAVDFDGTIVDQRFPLVGALKPGAREALTALKALGFYIMIYSCRTCKYWPEVFPHAEEDVMDRPVVRDMKDFLDNNRIPYDSIYDGEKGKPPCSYYVDDKAVEFRGSWAQTLGKIVSRELGSH